MTGVAVRVHHQHMAAQPPTPPGWYPHPEMAATLRYWDGSDWTEQVAPMAAQSEQAGLLVAGWVMAFLLPIGGFIVSLVLPWRLRRHQTPMLLVSLVTALLWYMLLLG